jgi:thiamine-phosphate pyrophosphorylase
MLLAVITQPAVFRGEAEYLEGLLEAGLEKLHLRKPGMERKEMEGLLERLAPRWAARLVVHGFFDLAVRYAVPQIHGRVGSMRSAGAVAEASAGSAASLAFSTSVHSWGELKALPQGLAYAFISPLFDSISKPGYSANKTLLRQPSGPFPCMPVGLGGISADTIGEMVRHGWKGAAVLGWIWERPRDAVKRYEQLKKTIDEQRIPG